MGALRDSQALIPERSSANFKRRRRLLEAKDFKRVFDENTFRSSNQNILVLALDSSSTTSARLGIVVAKKNVRRAVDRNRIKRLTREYFRQQVAPISYPMDFVVLARQGVGRLDNDGVRGALKGLFDTLLRKAAHAKQKAISQTP